MWLPGIKILHLKRAVKFMYTGQLKMTKQEIEKEHMVWHVNHILIDLFRVDAKLNLPAHLLKLPTNKVKEMGDQTLLKYQRLTTQDKTACLLCTTLKKRTKLCQISQKGKNSKCLPISKILPQTHLKMIWVQCYQKVVKPMQAEKTKGKMSLRLSLRR